MFALTTTEAKIILYSIEEMKILTKVFFFFKEKETVEGQAITFFSWDMKGGDLYENVHQCYVTAKTLYLLVWDMSEGMDGAHKLSSLLLNISVSQKQ